MTTPVTFGVTAATISARFQGVAIGASTVPDTTTVTDIITEAASFICGEAEYIGIDVAGLSSGTVTYGILRNLVIYRSAREVILSRDRAADLADAIKVLYDEAIDTLRKSAGRVKGSTESPDAVRSPAIPPDNTSAAAAARNATAVGRVINGGM